MNDSPIRRPDERAGLLLRELYRRHGYQSYRMSKFEPYDLYARNKSFLVSESWNNGKSMERPKRNWRRQ